MAKETNRLRPAQIEADRESLAALQNIANYAPANQAFALSEVARIHGELMKARAAESQAAAALATARDNAVAKEWEFHNVILGAKDQVMAQFGRDSNEVQALGLKKTSERKAPVRRAKKPTA